MDYSMRHLARPVASSSVAGLLLALAAAAMGARAAPLVGRRAESAAQCQRLLRLPTGTRSYLRDYGRLARFLFGPEGIDRNGEETGVAMLSRVRSVPGALAAYHGIERAILRGSRADALSKRILRTLLLNGRAAVAGKNSLAFCSLINRLRLAYLYYHRATELAHAGKRQSAYNALRCWLFLLSQDDVAASRLQWCNLNPIVVSKYGMPLEVFRSIRDYNRPAITARVRFNKLLSAIPRIGPRGTGAVKPTVVVSAVDAAWSAARGRVGWQYKILYALRNERQRAAEFGRRRCLLVLGRRIVSLRRQVNADRLLSHLQRAALLRWIKEAMGP